MKCRIHTLLTAAAVTTSWFVLSSGNIAGAQEAGSSERRVIVEYRDKSQMPNEVVFFTVAHVLAEKAEQYPDRALSHVKSKIGIVSDVAAAAFIDKIRDAVTEMDANHQTAKKRLLCNRGARQSKGFYYERLNTLQKARIADSVRALTLFMGSLTTDERTMFQDYLEDRKKHTEFTMYDFADSYENSPHDVRDVVETICTNGGESL